MGTRSEAFYCNGEMREGTTFETPTAVWVAENGRRIGQTFASYGGTTAHGASFSTMVNLGAGTLEVYGRAGPEISTYDPCRNLTQYFSVSTDCMASFADWITVTGPFQGSQPVPLTIRARLSGTLTSGTFDHAGNGDRPSSFALNIGPGFITYQPVVSPSSDTTLGSGTYEGPGPFDVDRILERTIPVTASSFLLEGSLSGVVHNSGVFSARVEFELSLPPGFTVTSRSGVFPGSGGIVEKQPGHLKRELFKNIPGALITDLTSSAGFPDSPSVVESITSFESKNLGDNYGERLSGYVKPPVSGNYVFYLASDDQGELWLSTDRRPANKRLIVSEPVWNLERNWLGATVPWDTNLYKPGRASQPIALEAGKYYFIEALHKEGGFGDHIAVAWQMPGGAPPPNGSDPIPNQYLYWDAPEEAQAITFNAPADKTYGDAPFTVAATASSGLPVSFESLTPEIIRIIGDEVTIVGTGIATIRASQPGDDVYPAASDVEQSFNVAKAQLIATGDELAKFYGDENPPITGSLAGVVNGDNITASYSTTATTTSDPGVYTVYVTLNDPDGRLSNYNVTISNGSLRIDRAPQVITFEALRVSHYGDDPFVVSVMANSGLPVTLTSSDSSVATVEGHTLAVHGAGTTELTAYQSGDANYLPADVVKLFYTVRRATPIVTWTTPADINCQTVLGAAQLNAAANVPGTFTYKPPAGSTLSMGDGQTLSVTFTPADTANFMAVMASTLINVRLDAGLATVWERNIPSTTLATLARAPGQQVAAVGYSWANGFDFSVAKYSTIDGSVVWQSGYDSPGNGYDQATAGTVDSAGNVVVTGYSVVGTGNQDYLTAKFGAADGALLWLKRYNGAANADEQARAIAVDSAGNVLVTGHSWNGSNWDILTQKHGAADGLVLWEQRYNGPANGHDYGIAVAVDSAGDVIVAGTSASDYYTAKYASANGALLWERRYSRGDDQIMAMTLDSQDNVIVTGFSSGAGVGYDFYTAKYAAADGVVIWGKHYNSVENRDEFGGDVKIDASGNVVVAGHASNGSTSDYLLAKYAAQDGTLLWEKRLPNRLGFLEGRTTLAADPNGDPVFTGLIRHADNSREIYTASYSSTDGSLIWEHRSPTTGNVPRPVVVEEDGDVITTGNLSLLLLRNGTKPSLTLLGEANMTIELGTAFNDPGATATDGCGNTLAVNVLGTVDHLTPGDYTLTYAATDSAGQSRSATRTVSVVITDHPPVAIIAGGDITSTIGANCFALIHIDGSSSFDSDGDSLIYNWYIWDDSGLLVGRASDRIGSTIDFGFYLVGNFTIELKVSSTRNGVTSTDTSTVNLTVLPGKPVLSGLSTIAAYSTAQPFDLTVSGGCFTGTTILWNGVSLPTTLSGSSLTAHVDLGTLPLPAAGIGVVLITVKNAYGQESDPLPFMILAPEAGPSEAAYVPPGEEASVSTAPTVGGTSGVAVAVENNGGAPVTVLAATYESTPESGNLFEVADGVAVDVQITGADENDRAGVAFFYPNTLENEDDLKLRFYNHDTLTGVRTWLEVLSSGGVLPEKNTTNNLNETISGGRFIVIFDNTSTPKITELTGTIFGMFSPVPQILEISGPPAPLSVGSQATISFSYATSMDGQNCEITFDWNDGTTTTLNSVNGIASAQHTFVAPGVYKVGVTVNDPTTGPTNRDFNYVVVYDPNGGFVTGGGWINSPLGAFRLSPELSGEARFGFVSKYKKGSSVPVGQTEFQFELANFGFQSSSYQWLVVSGGKAQFKGLGTVNGAGEFGFLLTATDSDKYAGGADKFRIKIWEIATDSIVYDNGLDAPDSLEASNPQEISGGSIVIHRP
jgi:hypothetical protein